MKYFEVVFAIFAIAFFGDPVPKSESSVLAESEKKNQERYRAVLAVLMGKLEASVGITFAAEPPSVQFGYPPNGNRHGSAFVAEYLPETNSIRLNPVFELCETAPVLALSGVKLKRDRNSLAACGTPEELRDALCHELGHYYVDLMIERQFPESWIAEPRRKGQTVLSLKDQMGVPIVNEGIATYFGKALGSKREPSFNEKRWEKKYGESELLADLFLTELITYNGGYSLVKPIVDRYGVRGIAYLVSHPLRITLPDLDTIIPYREQAMRDLAVASPFCRGIVHIPREQALLVRKHLQCIVANGWARVTPGDLYHAHILLAARSHALQHFDSLDALFSYSAAILYHGDEMLFRWRLDDGNLAVQKRRPRSIIGYPDGTVVPAVALFDDPTAAPDYEWYGTIHPDDLARERPQLFDKRSNKEVRTAAGRCLVNLQIDIGLGHGFDPTILVGNDRLKVTADCITPTAERLAIK